MATYSATLTSSRTVNGSFDPFTVYVVNVRKAEAEWHVFRRYSQWDQLRAALQSAVRSAPELPRKEFFGRMRPEVIEERVLGLGQFLQSALSLDCYASSPALAEFLERDKDQPPSGIEGWTDPIPPDSSPPVASGDAAPTFGALCDAASKGEAELVAQIIAQAGTGAAALLMEAKERSGFTALHFGAGSAGVVTALLAAGAKVDTQSHKGTTALCNAAIKGAEAAVRLLLDGGADVNGAGGPNPLNQAITKKQEGAALLLVQAGADLAVVEATGYSSLHYAANVGLVAVAKAMLAGGANPDARSTEQGYTALHIAVRRWNDIRWR